MNKSISLQRVALLIIVALAYSCGQAKYNVTFDGEYARENKVFVGEIDLSTIDTSNKYPYIRLAKGSHQLKINDEIHDFNVTGFGHLNITGADMGIYPIEYVLGEPDLNQHYGLPAPFIYDSTLYYDPSYGNMTPGIALELARTKKRNTYPYEGSAEIVKIPKDVYFIKHNWDIEIGQDAPEDLMEAIDPDVSQMMVFKTALGEGYLVCVHAMFSLGYEGVRISEIGKEKEPAD